MDNITMQTRRDSFDAVMPKAKKRALLVLETLGDREMTVSEITEELTDKGVIPYFNRNYVAPRMTELRDFGLVEAVGKRMATRSDRAEAVWRRTERQMTREEVKAALKSYRALKREHDDLVRRREEIEASVLGSPRLDGMPHGGSVSNPTANIGAALAELSTLYDGKARQLAAAMILVEDMIDHLADPTQRMIARLYYIDGLTWEQVCVAANYSWRQTHRIHAALLDELSEKEGKE